MQHLPMDSNEFSTSIDELLEEDDRYSIEQCSNSPVTKQSQLHVRASDPSLAYKKDEQWIQEWCFNLKRDDISNMLILAACFAILTNPFLLKMLQPYMPVFFESNSIGYNAWGTYMFGAIFSLIYAFMTLK